MKDQTSKARPADLAILLSDSFLMEEAKKFDLYERGTFACFAKGIRSAAQSFLEYVPDDVVYREIDELKRAVRSRNIVGILSRLENLSAYTLDLLNNRRIEVFDDAKVLPRQFSQVGIVIPARRRKLIPENMSRLRLPEAADIKNAKTRDKAIQTILMMTVRGGTVVVGRRRKVTALDGSSVFRNSRSIDDTLYAPEEPEPGRPANRDAHEMVEDLRIAFWTAFGRFPPRTSSYTAPSNFHCFFKAVLTQIGAGHISTTEAINTVDRETKLGSPPFKL